MAACLLFLYSATRSAVTRAQESLRLHGLVAVSDAHCLPSEAARTCFLGGFVGHARFPAQVCKRPSSAQQMQFVQWRVSAVATRSRDFTLKKSFFKGCQVQPVCPLSQEGVEAFMAVTLEAVGSTDLLGLSRNLLTSGRFLRLPAAYAAMLFGRSNLLELVTPRSFCAPLGMTPQEVQDIMEAPPAIQAMHARAQQENLLPPRGPPGRKY